MSFLLRNLSQYKFYNWNQYKIVLTNFHRFNFTNRICKNCISSKIYDDLNYKGLLCSIFPNSVDANKLLSSKQTIYAGFDATNDSLHVGNLLVLITLLHLLKHGHRVIFLIGDSTARIGDPSGKTLDRKSIDKDTIERNAHGIENDILKILENFQLNFGKNKINSNNFVICRNSDWYHKLNVIDFISQIRHIRVGDMLNKSAIKERLQSDGLSFTEFSYQTFQAYDWFHLFKKFNCKIQIGGVDQIVNIHNGYDLIKKTTETLTCGLFIPLIVDDKGNKFGKSEGKAVFLNSSKTSEFNFFQFFMRLRDSDMNQYLKMFSFRSHSDIENIIQNHLRKPRPWALQKILAEEIVVLVHGKSGLEAAQRITRAIFDKDLELLGNLHSDQLEEVYSEASKHHMEFIPGNITALNVAMKTGFFNTELEAIRTIQEGGFYINYVRISDPSKVLTEEYILNNSITIISVGKRKYSLVKWL